MNMLIGSKYKIISDITSVEVLDFDQYKVVSCVKYSNLIKSMIYEAKMESNYFFYTNFFQLLRENSLDDLFVIKKKLVSLVVNIPSDRGRITSRGFDHSKELSLSLSRSKKIKYLELFIKSQESSNRSLMTKSDRVEDDNYFVVDNFMAEENSEYISNVDNLIIVDDLITTGSTVDNLIQTLTRSKLFKVNIKITVICIAFVD